MLNVQIRDDRCHMEIRRYGELSRKLLRIIVRLNFRVGRWADWKRISIDKIKSVKRFLHAVVASANLKFRFTNVSERRAANGAPLKYNIYYNIMYIYIPIRLYRGVGGGGKKKTERIR